MTTEFRSLVQVPEGAQRRARLVNRNANPAGNYSGISDFGISGLECLRFFVFSEKLFFVFLYRCENSFFNPHFSTYHSDAIDGEGNEVSLKFYPTI
jgi:hypothetical protein